VSAVRAPTLLIGVGDFGEAALARLVGEIRSVGEAPVRTLAVHASQDLQRVADSVRKIIDDLLRTRLSRVGVGRLDVAVIGDLSSPQHTLIDDVLQVVSEVLVDFRQALPIPRAPEQRTVTMVAMLGAPPLLSVDDVRPLHAIERWHLERAASKALSRVFVLSRQHAGGTLDDEDVLRGVVLLAESIYLSGLRDHDEVGARLQHRRDGDLFVLFNAAAADVPVDSVVRYCAWRTAMAGAETLQLRCASTSTVGAQDLARGQLEHESWVVALQSGDAARKARTFDSDSLRSVAPPVPQRFSWTASNASIRAAITPLLTHAGATGDAPQRGRAAPVHEDTVRALDRAELDQLEVAGERIASFLRTELAPETGARNLPRVLAALDAVEEHLDQQAQAELPSVEAQRVTPLDLTAEHEAVELALRRRSRPASAVATALSLAALAALVGAAVVVTVQAAPGAAGSTAGPAAAVTITKAAGAASSSSNLTLLGTALGAGLLVGGAWLGARLMDQSRALSAALSGLAAAAGRARRTPSSSGSTVALALRQRRLARALLQRVIAARQRVAGLRIAISDLRDRARRELRGLGFVAADGQRPGNAAAVLGPESPLHRHLISSEGLERLWTATRETAEEEHWATQLLEAAWPQAGLANDLPFEPGAAWETETLVQQHRALLESSVFGWSEVRGDVAERLAAFLRSAVDPQVVGMAVAPADKDGVPLASNQRAAVIVIAPSEAQGLLAGAGDVRFPFVTALATVPSSRVVVLRAHPGCSASEIAFGVQAREAR